MAVPAASAEPLIAEKRMDDICQVKRGQEGEKKMALSNRGNSPWGGNCRFTLRSPHCNQYVINQQQCVDYSEMSTSSISLKGRLK